MPIQKISIRKCIFGLWISLDVLLDCGFCDYPHSIVVLVICKDKIWFWIVQIYFPTVIISNSLPTISASLASLSKPYNPKTISSNSLCASARSVNRRSRFSPYNHNLVRTKFCFPKEFFSLFYVSENCKIGIDSLYLSWEKFQPNGT